MSIIVLSNHNTRIGAWVTRKKGILYNIINCHARVSHKLTQNTREAWVTTLFTENQNAPRPSEFVTLHLGSDGCH